MPNKALWAIGKKPRKTLRQLYLEICRKFKRQNRTCLATRLDTGRLCGAKARDVHHLRGRTGTLLIDERFFMPVCRPCHNSIHDPSDKTRHIQFFNIAGPGKWRVAPDDEETHRLRLMIRRREL